VGVNKGGVQFPNKAAMGRGHEERARVKSQGVEREKGGDNKGRAKDGCGGAAVAASCQARAVVRM
jgi:hypothetical protein